MRGTFTPSRRGTLPRFLALPPVPEGAAEGAAGRRAGGAVFGSDGHRTPLRGFQRRLFRFDGKAFHRINSGATSVANFLQPDLTRLIVSEMFRGLRTPTLLRYD